MNQAIDLVQHCTTMEDVRRNVNALDDVLVPLLVTRIGYMQRAARIKGDVTQVRDEDRIEAIVQRVRASAALHGGAPDVIEAAAKRLMDEDPKFPPNLPQLEKVCEAITPRKTYAEEAGLPRLPAPEPAAPMKVSFEMRGDGKDWARRIMARQEAGDRIRPYALQCARQALGMEGKMAWQ